MLENYQKFKFSITYSFAGFIREKVLDNAEEEYIADLVEPQSIDKIAKPKKITVLHDYIQWELDNEIEYLERKIDPDLIIGEWESLLSDYSIKFEQKTDDEDEYTAYLASKIVKFVTNKIANEVFQVLFGDRIFCMEFNKIISEGVKEYKKVDYPLILQKDGKVKRCA